VKRFVRKIHIYCGLLVFSQFLVYGIAGLVATMQPSLERPKSPRAVRYIPFEVQPGESDKSIAARVYEVLKPPMSRPVPDWFLQHTPQGQLQLDFYNINGIFRAVVFPNEQRVRVEEIRNSTALFLEDIHAATLGDSGAPGLVRLWAAWNEVAMWALLLFCASGLYLWLASRPKVIWAWAALAGSTAVFVSLWMVFR
jgi:uncharacterized iron-regulated membrane protein